MNTFTKVILFTDNDGLSKFREESIDFDEGNELLQKTRFEEAEGLQFRFSPVGFRSPMHWTHVPPQWVFVLSGAMEIGLADGSTRVFIAGEHFISADTPPEGVVMDPAKHGHWSRQLGNQPLVTLFVRCGPGQF